MLVVLFYVTAILWIILLGITVAAVLIFFNKLEKIKKIRVNPIFQGLIVGLILWGGQNILNVILKSFYI